MLPVTDSFPSIVIALWRNSSRITSKSKHALVLFSNEISNWLDDEEGGNDVVVVDGDADDVDDDNEEALSNDW